ncbi:LysR substrate-binding domain-containing protein [Streptomyces sp. NPDC051453]|uniref:LysR substrate-binding domain-containing protein n=1 Tax=Streptomyces sp. NPDC051453 TaxID=3154941 RepID=UPI003449DC56
MATDDVDVALLRLPVPAQSDFDVEVLLTKPRWIALPAGHRLAGEDQIRFRDLYDEPFVAANTAAGMRRNARDPRRPLTLLGLERSRTGRLATTPKPWPGTSPNTTSGCSRSWPRR